MLNVFSANFRRHPKDGGSNGSVRFNGDDNMCGANVPPRNSLLNRPLRSRVLFHDGRLMVGRLILAW